jgi:cobalt-precorrin-5B (C1)-methyltransferase
MARSGYTLPVFAVAAAKAALLHLQTRHSPREVRVDLLPDTATIPIQQVAALTSASALAITLSDPGDNLDLTRHTPVWAWVQCQPRPTEPEGERLHLLGGEGLGHDATGKPAIYAYARQLFTANLLPLIPTEQTITVTIILPEGRQLAERTSNAAFGIVEGLSLLGTSGIAKPLSAEEHLEDLRQVLQAKVQTHPDLVFCIGSYGLKVAAELGFLTEATVQTGNWVGALLLEAAICGATSVLLLGYQGKLIKLAGGIFNTSSHLADARLEIISAAVLKVGGSLEAATAVLAAKTADAAYQTLVELGLADAVFQHLAAQISTKAQNYVRKYADVDLAVSTYLLDRRGNLVGASKTGKPTS